MMGIRNSMKQTHMKKHNTIILVIILAVGTLTQVCTDMYTPSLPAIAHYFHADVGQAQFTMTALMLGMTLTCLLYGPLSEVIGRRLTLILGIFIAIVGAAICLFAHSITILQLGRFIQGCGLGACSTLWRSIFRDTYSGDELASVSSYLTNFILLSVVLAPIMGGYFEQYFNWQTTFIVLLAWSVIVLAMVAFLFKETGQHHGKHRLNIKFIVSTYRELLTTRSFMGFTFCSLLTFGGLFAWLTAGSVVLIKGAGMQPVSFGWLSIITGLAMALGGTLNGKFVKQIGSRIMMQWGWALMTLAGTLLFSGYYVFGITVWSVLAPAVIFIFGSTLVFANAFSNAFLDIGHIAGYGGALYSGIQLMGGVVFSAILSHLNASNPVPMAGMFIASGVLAWMVYKFVAAHQ